MCTERLNAHRLELVAQPAIDPQEPLDRFLDFARRNRERFVAPPQSTPLTPRAGLDEELDFDRIDWSAVRATPFDRYTRAPT
jgi:hypothetical protein